MIGISDRKAVMRLSGDTGITIAWRGKPVLPPYQGFNKLFASIEITKGGALRF